MDYAATRANMVDGQVRTNKVIAPGVIAALRTVPREAFVPEALRSVAYVDEDLTVAPGRYLLEPMVVGRLLQAAKVKKTDRALDFATGTGYGAALLTHLAGSVTALDSRSDLLDIARRTLATASVPVIFVEAALDTLSASIPGLAANSFNVVLVSGALSKVPPSLFDLLAEGGRLVAVEKSQGQANELKPIGTAMLYIKQGREISARALFDAGTPLLPEFVHKPRFVF